ncbi:MAG: hypothetical protein KC621_12525, partial [Myxococcales bacterium]|nr:hypothetical protein [Myxococcales bacterium]
VDDAKVVSLRGKLIGQVTEPSASTPVEVVYRMRRLAIEAGDWKRVDALSDELLRRGEAAPPDRAPLERLEIEDLALALSKQSTPDIPFVYPSEVVELGDKLQKLWTLAARYADLAAVWEALQERTDASTPRTRAAMAWLEAKDVPRATADADAAYTRAGGPRDVDLAATDEERLRAEIGAALMARAQIHARTGNMAAARSDYGTAVLLRGALVDTALGEQLDRHAAPIEAGMTWRAPRNGIAADAALAAAEAETDLDKRRAILAEARFLAFSGMGNGRSVADQAPLWSGPIVRAYDLEAIALQAAGEHEEARTCAMIATLLSGRSGAQRWELRGREQHALGEDDAAFVSLSVARALGAEGLDELLAATHHGGGDWEADTAIWTAGLAAEAPAPAPKVGRPGAAPAPTVSRGAGPRLGDSFPPFVVKSDAGTLSVAALRGRVVIVTAMELDCADCMRMAPAMALMVRKLRADGTDTAMIVLSLDEDEEDFQRMQTMGRSWGEVVWAPALRQTFGIRKVPTTWLVDRDGTTRYFFDHWLSADELRAQIENLD